MKQGAFTAGRDGRGGFMWEYKGTLLRLGGEEIYYLHTERGRLFIHTERSAYEIGGKMGDEEILLRELPLVRTHSSYLVNIHFLKQMNRSEAVLKNGERIPVSEKRRKHVYSMIRAGFHSRVCTGRKGG